MNTFPFRAAWAAAALALPCWAVTPALAQTGMDHNSPTGMTAAPEMTDGEVKKVDKDAGKITLRHGEIKHMDMPGMTMVFVVKDKALLDAVSVGAKVRFMAVRENGRMVVTDIQPAR